MIRGCYLNRHATLIPYTQLQSCLNGIQKSLAPRQNFYDSQAPLDFPHTPSPRRQLQFHSAAAKV